MACNSPIRKSRSIIQCGAPPRVMRPIRLHEGNRDAAVHRVPSPGTLDRLFYDGESSAQLTSSTILALASRASRLLPPTTPMASNLTRSPIRKSRSIIQCGAPPRVMRPIRLHEGKRDAAVHHVPSPGTLDMAAVLRLHDGESSAQLTSSTILALARSICPRTASTQGQTEGPTCTAAGPASYGAATSEREESPAALCDLF